MMPQENQRVNESKPDRATSPATNAGGCSLPAAAPWPAKRDASSSRIWTTDLLSMESARRASISMNAGCRPCASSAAWLLSSAAVLRDLWSPKPRPTSPASLVDQGYDIFQVELSWEECTCLMYQSSLDCRSLPYEQEIHQRNIPMTGIRKHLLSSSGDCCTGSIRRNSKPLLNNGCKVIQLLQIIQRAFAKKGFAEFVHPPSREDRKRCWT